ncbi:hypothetical protein [Georgenia yuyongxinii]
MHLPLTSPDEPHRPSTPGGGRDLAAVLGSAERDAAARLQAAAGNASLCTLSRDGAPHPAAKHAEGALAALGEARRALSPATGGTDDCPIAEVEGVRQRCEGRAQAAPSSPAWTAYLAGGIDALTQVTDAHAGLRDDSSAPDCLPVAHATAAAPPAAGERATRAPVTVPLHPRVWGRRRTLTAVVLAPALFAALTVAGGGWAPALAPLWTAVVALTALGAAATLATYVPLRGRAPRLGCTPCAAASAMTVLGAGWALGVGPHQATMAGVALTLVAFGLVQRLTGAGTSCTT